MYTATLEVTGESSSPTKDGSTIFWASGGSQGGYRRPVMRSFESAAKDTIVSIEDPRIEPFPMQNIAPHPKDAGEGVLDGASSLGQHNDEVYEKVLGLSEEDREDLSKREVI